jgi:hypothetical protein
MDPHPNEKVEALKSHFGAMEGQIKMEDPYPDQSER